MDEQNFKFNYVFQGQDCTLSTGVYKITIQNHVYIGSAAISFRKRWRQHQLDFIRDIHHSRFAQNAFNKYGIATFEIIERVYSEKESIVEESDKDVSADMERAGSVFRRSATECRGISSDTSGTLYHKNRPLTKLDVDLSSLASVDEFNLAFSWTHIKLIKINNLYISGDDLTNIIRSIFTVILKGKSLDKLKLLCKGAGILNKTVAAMERKKVNFIKDDPSVVNVKGSTGNKIRGLVYILRWTNHADMIDGIEFYTTNQ